MTALLRLHQWGCDTPHGRPLFRGLDLQLAAGERLAITGRNGAGKSSLLLSLLGFHPQCYGDLFWQGHRCQRAEDFVQLRKGMGLVFQDPNDQLFCATVLDELCFGPLNLGWSQQQALAAAETMLAAFGLEDLADAVPHHLSFGQKRMVALASVAVMRPQVLVLDEPDAGLDDVHQDRLLRWLAPQKAAVLITSHAPDFLTALGCETLALPSP